MLETAVILAGGKSSRMGQDKALMPFGGYGSMVEYQYAKMSKIFKKVYISTKEDKFNFKANLILDRYKESSPLVAIASVLEEINEDFFLISVDMPLIPIEDIENLKHLYIESQKFEIYTIKTENGIEPTVSIYTKAILPKVQNMLKSGNHKLKELIKICGTKVVNTDSGKSYLNVNTEDDYNSAKQFINNDIF